MSKKKQTIICFAGCDWWYHNRGLFCPQIMSRLVKDHKVLFVNSLGMRVPSLKKDGKAIRKIFSKLKSITRFLRKDRNGLFVLSPISIPLNSEISRAINNYFVYLQIKLVMFLINFKNPVFYVNCPIALDIVKRIKRKYLIYERTDLFEEMDGIDKSYISFLDKSLTEQSDLVLYVNKRLWEKDGADHKKSLLIGHGVEYDLFVNAEKTEDIPADINGIDKPIIGYFGGICNNVDIQLLAYAARKLPDLSFVFVGSISTDVSVLQKIPNIYFLGQKPYEQIPHYGKYFDVAIMAWKKNKWIEFCNPIKIKEYLALGKPVVSTYYPEIEPFSDVVCVANDQDDFVFYIKDALSEKDQADVRKRQEKVSDETWDNKTKQIVEFMERDLKNRT